MIRRFRFFDWITGRMPAAKLAVVRPGFDRIAAAFAACGQTIEQATVSINHCARLIRAAQWREYHKAGCPYGENRDGLMQWWEEYWQLAE